MEKGEAIELFKEVCGKTAIEVRRNRHFWQHHKNIFEVQDNDRRIRVDSVSGRTKIIVYQKSDSREMPRPIIFDITNEEYAAAAKSYNN